MRSPHPGVSILLALAAACGPASPEEPGSSRTAAPLRSPCQAGELPLLAERGFRCPGGPESPLTRDPTFWAFARPCARIAEQQRHGQAFLEVGVERYDYRQLFAFPGGEYDEDGDLIALYFDDGTTISYEYDDGTLVSATGPNARYHFRYQEGRRLAQVEARIDGREVQDIYDARGRRAALRWLRATPEPHDGGLFGYDDQGLLIREVHWTPGQERPDRWSYTYVDGELQTATVRRGSGEPRAERWRYLYDCSLLTP
jgi:hypothetical protein